MWIEYNPNPQGKNVGDCVVRAISKALDLPWENTYILLCVEGLMRSDLPSSNDVWSKFLKSRGFKRCTVEDCHDCYTVDDFCREHPKGVYVIGTGSHAVCVIDADIFDAWNSSRENVVYYFEEEK